MGRSVLIVVVVTLLAAVASGGYVITTPRRWTSGGFTKVCVHLDGKGQEEAGLSVTLKNHEDKELVPFTPLPVDAGQLTKCHDIFLPKGSDHRGKIQFFGVLDGKTINETRDMDYTTSTEKTFVQTDKFLYKPGQLVRFRILTIKGPFLKISTDMYPQVHIENPSGTRIAQWLNVSNENGLIHLEMQLTDEPDEGKYLIKVKTKEGVISSRSFKVEEYVLPRFEIKITNPKYILGTDEFFTFKVCADYTYGQPVKGNLTFTVQNGGWGRYRIEKMYIEQIFGCKDVRIESEEIKFNSDDYSVYRVSVHASVVEEGTGVEISGSSSVSVSRSAINFETISKEEYLKPALPYTARMKATRPDGSAAGNEPMKVCVVDDCKQMITDQQGILTFLVPPNIMKESASVSIKVTATNYPRIESPSSTWRSIMYESSQSLHITRYYSPSNSSLVLHVPSGTLSCKGRSDQYELDLMYSTVNQSSAKITVQVVSRGQIQYQDTSEYPLVASSLPIDDSILLIPMELPKGSNVVVGSIKIPVTLKATTSPKAKVLVWYSRDDGEVVSETAEVDISKCLENKVGLSWSVEKAQPGDQATVSMSAEPNSLCSLGVVDKSVELLSSQNDDLTLDGIFSIIENSMVDRWVNQQVDDYTYCKLEREKEPIHPVGPPGVPFDDAPVPLAAAGDVEGAGREKRSSVPWYGHRGFSRYVDALKMFDESGLYIITDLTVETRPCSEPIGMVEDRVYFAEYEDEELPLAFDGVAYVPGVAFEGTPISSDREHDTVKKEQARTYFPETWLWNLQAVGETGVNEQDLTLPDTVTEWIGKAVCVHQEKGLGISSRAPITTFTPFFAELTLPPSVKRGEVLPVKISVFNYLEQKLPVKIVLHSSPEYEILPAKDDNPALPEESHAFGERSACVTAQDKATHTIRIRPTEIGNVNITVSAFVDKSYNEECGSTDISKRDTLVKPILVEAEGFPREKTWTKYICTKDLENNVDALDVWQVELPSTIVEGSARGWVTIAGDLLGPTIDNLGSLIKKPYGCGEQNMLNFAPNIFIMQYLDASKQTTKDVAERAIGFMKTGYQRELKYRHSDGSFSAFGESDESGSTWLTAFVVKSFAQAQQYILVDQDDLTKSMSWLRRQQRENGCFQSVGKVLHKGMKGGIAENSSEAPLTAYVLLALLEAGQNAGDDVVNVGVECLLRDENPSSYTLALISYALALADHPKADTYIQQLLGKSAKSSSSIYWETVAGPGKSDAVAVETAGYAVLAMMTFDAVRYDPEAIKIVKWLSSKRNGQGGFVSTQDTVVALQALAAYAKTLSQGGTDVVVTVNAQNLEHSFFVKESNKLLQQMVPLPTLPTDVAIDMSGDGCVLMQAVLRYNVPIPSPVDAFNLSVYTDTVGDETCITKQIRVCAAYLLPDKKSNMAVVEVNLVSGYFPDKQDLKQLVGYGTGLFKRYEVDGSKINIYVDEFSAEPLCLDFKILRHVDVENAKPGTVMVYDYYQPEFSISQKYTLPPNDECLPWVNPIIDLIIPDPPESEPVNADNDNTTIRPEDIEGLIGALDGVIDDYV